ncbi:MAG: hypothetical protein LBT25_02350, partial [Candidatus Symbiothrix sp.]|nr:hypothetical protein [Candidatus Symbiothrix sp.]
HNGGVWSSLDKNDKLKHQFYTRYACLSIAEKPLYAKLVLILYFIMLSIDNSTEYAKMQNMMKSVHTFGSLKMIRTIFYMLKK